MTWKEVKKTWHKSIEDIEEIWVSPYIWSVLQNLSYIDLYAGSFHEKRVYTRICLNKGLYELLVFFWKVHRCIRWLSLLKACIYAGLFKEKRVCNLNWWLLKVDWVSVYLFWSLGYLWYSGYSGFTVLFDAMGKGCLLISEGLCWSCLIQF